MYIYKYSDVEWCEGQVYIYIYTVYMHLWWLNQKYQPINAINPSQYNQSINILLTLVSLPLFVEVQTLSWCLFSLQPTYAENNNNNNSLRFTSLHFYTIHLYIFTSLRHTCWVDILRASLPALYLRPYIFIYSTHTVYIYMKKERTKKWKKGSEKLWIEESKKKRVVL